MISLKFASKHCKSYVQYLQTQQLNTKLRKVQMYVARWSLQTVTDLEINTRFQKRYISNTKTQQSVFHDHSLESYCQDCFTERSHYAFNGERGILKENHLRHFFWTPVHQTKHGHRSWCHFFTTVVLFSRQNIWEQ